LILNGSVIKDGKVAGVPREEEGLPPPLIPAMFDIVCDDIGKVVFPLIHDLYFLAEFRGGEVGGDRDIEVVPREQWGEVDRDSLPEGQRNMVESGVG
jgi:hypothetical protein